MKNIIAIDIGGTKTHGALINEHGDLLKDQKIATNPKLGAQHLLKSLFELIDDLKKGVEVVGIGVASAGRINVDKGSVFYATDNIPGWTGVDIRSFLEEIYHVPVFVDDDVNAAGPGEEWLGALKGYYSYVLIALGTGIGGSVKVNGKLLRGAHWSGGELGHMLLYPHGRHCNCGLDGCFEQYCSGTALVKRYCQLCDGKIDDGYELFKRFHNDDTIAKQVIDEFVEDLSLSIISLSNIYDPQIIVIGGGLIDTKDVWWNDLLNYVSSSAITSIFSPKVVPAQLGNLAGLYGITKLTLEYIENR